MQLHFSLKMCGVYFGGMIATIVWSPDELVQVINIRVHLCSPNAGKVVVPQFRVGLTHFEL